MYTRPNTSCHVIRSIKQNALLSITRPKCFMLHHRFPGPNRCYTLTRPKRDAIPVCYNTKRVCRTLRLYRPTHDVVLRRKQGKFSDISTILAEQSILGLIKTLTLPSKKNRKQYIRHKILIQTKFHTHVAGRAGRQQEVKRHGRSGSFGPHKYHALPGVHSGERRVRSTNVTIPRVLAYISFQGGRGVGWGIFLWLSFWVAFRREDAENSLHASRSLPSLCDCPFFF